MKTLAERVGWIVDNRLRPDGGTWTDRALSDAAGLSPAHVGMIRRGDAKKVTAETIEVIATTAGVSAGWLAFGRGSPDADDVPSVGDSNEAVRENIAGWADAEATVRQMHPEWTDEAAFEAARKSGPHMVHGPITVLVVEELVRMAIRLGGGGGIRGAQVRDEIARQKEERQQLMRDIASGKVAQPEPPPLERKPRRRKG